MTASWHKFLVLPCIDEPSPADETPTIKPNYFPLEVAGFTDPAGRRRGSIRGGSIRWGSIRWGSVRWGTVRWGNAPE